MTQNSSEPLDDAAAEDAGDRLRHIDQLRRSVGDRYVGGVAAGLARHFDIDPTIVRVLFVASCLFSGAGVVVYLALWVFTPDEDGQQAAIHTSADARRAIFFGLGALAVAALVVDGTVGIGWRIAWPMTVLAAVAGVVLLVARRRDHTDTPTGSAALERTTAPRPQAPDYTRRPRRTGVLLFWPTLALLALALGCLGLYAAGGHHVSLGAWSALALAVIGLMLVIGAFAGRPGGLPLLGVLALATLASSAAAGDLTQWDGTVRVAPASSTALHDRYRITNGRLDLDLSRISPADLGGHTMWLSMNAGDMEVTVPRNVRVDVDASLDLGGDVEVDGRNRSGFATTLERTIAPTATGTTTGSGAPTLHLVARGRIGRINVFPTKEN